ncbi:hypothetical protein HanPI659440_Chr09g0335991 [Helianthus annuus]|nr:hypothetical protein HanPI659440_Chr09g0335991 [Helianthus annuus]
MESAFGVTLNYLSFDDLVPCFQVDLIGRRWNRGLQQMVSHSSACNRQIGANPQDR